MQVTRRASKRRSGLRFWNRAPGIKSNMRTPHTRQPLTGVTLWGLVVGAVLVFGAQAAWAHTGGEPLPPPTCSGLPGDTFLDTPLELTAAGVSGYNDADQPLTLKAGDEESEGNPDFHYGRITVPPLTAGELRVTSAIESDPEPTNAILCRPGESNPLAESREAYTAEHRRDDNAAAAADAAAEKARLAVAAVAATTATVADMEAAVRAAIQALVTAETALVTAGLEAIDAVGTAIETLEALEDGGTIDTGTDTTDALTTARAQLTAVASALREAIEAEHMGSGFTAYIGSGMETYIVVLAHGDDAPPTVNVRFSGLMGTSPLEQLVGTAGSVETNATYTFTTNVEGLFMGDTTGRAAKGELTDSNSAIVGVDTATGKVGITAPLNTAGEYTLTVMDMGTSGGGNVTLSAWFRSSTELTAPTAEGTATTGTITPGKAKYYHFTGVVGILTLTAKEARQMGADTMGVLYSKNGQIAMNADIAGGMDFEIMVPILVGDYILEVKGDTAQVAGNFTITGKSSSATAVTALPSLEQDRTLGAEPAHFIFEVEEPGWVQVKITDADTPVEGLDTDAVLTGPSGPVASAEGEGHANFAAMVMMGQHLLTVTGKGTVQGGYKLTVNFIEQMAFAGQQPMIPDSDTALAMACTDQLGYQEVTEASCQAAGVTTTVVEEVVRVEYRTASCPSGGGGGGGGSSANVNTCRTFSNAAVDDYKDSLTVTTDATGVLENPSGNGYRSGIGVISGWVCAANAVEVRISDDSGMMQRQQVGYGTSRKDVQMAGVCDHDEDTVGFGLTYNFNHLDEGSYTIAAYADDTMIGMEQSFMVVHLEEFADSDEDRFLRDLAGMCAVEDFPMASDVTTLVWEQSIQNFVIEAVDMMEEGGEAEENTQ